MSERYLNHNNDSAETMALRVEVELNAEAAANASMAFVGKLAQLKVSERGDRTEREQNRIMKGPMGDTPSPMKALHAPHLGSGGKRIGDMGTIFGYKKMLKGDSIKLQKEGDHSESYGGCAYDSRDPYAKSAYDPHAKSTEEVEVVDAMCSSGGESTPGASTPSTEVESCGGTPGGEDDVLDNKG
jgi:hypothetical protein